jgi:hypothetical protein
VNEADIMNIAGYHFGRIEIDGRVFTSDITITPERVDDTWWRHESHSLAIADVAGIVAAKPDILVIGTGYFGRMTVPDATRRHLEAQGIEVRQLRTGKAVQEFNRLQTEPRRIAAALHLTC